MFIIYLCVPIWAFFPLIALVVYFFKRRIASSTQILASTGAVSVNLSFFYLPWLDLSPLKELFLGEVVGIAPDAAGYMLAWRGMDGAAQKMEFLASALGIFEPPGWATLFLTSPHWLLTLLLLIVGLITVLLAVVLIIWRSAPSVFGLMMAGSSAALLFVILYFLPEIEGVGERAFPDVRSLIAPLLQVEINWFGPLVMMVGLLLMLVAGLMQVQQPISDDISNELYGMGVE